MIDLTWVLGTYSPVLDPVTGSIAQGMAGVDWTYITKAEFLLIAFMTVMIAFTRFIKGVHS
jgi:hypothetical protein